MSARKWKSLKEQGLNRGPNFNRVSHVDTWFSFHRTGKLAPKWLFQEEQRLVGKLRFVFANSECPGNFKESRERVLVGVNCIHWKPTETLWKMKKFPTRVEFIYMKGARIFSIWGRFSFQTFSSLTAKVPVELRLRVEVIIYIDNIPLTCSSVGITPFFNNPRKSVSSRLLFLIDPFICYHFMEWTGFSW